MDLPYKLDYDYSGKVQGIHFWIADTWATVPFNSSNKTFNESNIVTKALRDWEKTNGTIDLSDKAPTQPETISSPTAEEVMASLNPGEIAYRDANGQLVGMPIASLRQVKSVNGKSDTVSLTATDVGAEPSGAVSSHKSETTAHTIAQIDGLPTVLSNKQALSTILTAIASLQSAGVIEVKTNGSVATIAISDAARSLLDDTDIPAIRATLQLGNAALLDVGTGASSVAAGNDSRFNNLGGTVKSVGLTLPTTVFDVSTQPVTSSGNLSANFKNQSPALVFASPISGNAAAVPIFRALVASDIPTLTAAKIADLATGTWADLPLAPGWTNPLLTAVASYIKLSIGLVMVRGQISKLSKPTSGEAVATLGTGFRPSSSRRFLSSNNSNSSRPVLEINPNTGVISYTDLGTIPSSVSELLLSPIIFFAG